LEENSLVIICVIRGNRKICTDEKCLFIISTIKFPDKSHFSL
jgi:hypothetical protein